MYMKTLKIFQIGSVKVEVASKLTYLLIYIQHKNRIHNENDNGDQCNICHKNYKSLRTHLKEIHKDIKWSKYQKLQCDYCDKYMCKVSLPIHIKNKHHK